MSVWWLKICAACQAPFSLSKHSIRWSFARIYFKISWAYMIHVQNPFCVWVFRQRDVVQMCFRLAEQHAIAACWGACPCTHEEPVFLSFAVSPPTKTKTTVVTHTKRTDPSPASISTTTPSTWPCNESINEGNGASHPGVIPSDPNYYMLSSIKSLCIMYTCM